MSFEGKGRVNQKQRLELSRPMVESSERLTLVHVIIYRSCIERRSIT
jgi:hypothetical protein